MNIFSQWPSWHQCEVRVRVAVLDAFLRILQTMYLLLAITAWPVAKRIAVTRHALEQWRKQERT